MMIITGIKIIIIIVIIIIYTFAFSGHCFKKEEFTHIWRNVASHSIIFTLRTVRLRFIGIEIRKAQT